MSMGEQTGSIFINGLERHFDLHGRDLLIDVIRQKAGLKGTKRSCDVQVCGACTVLVDDQLRSSCCTLAMDALGKQVLTIEGANDDPLAQKLQYAFARHGALQCGFCTPGILLASLSLLRRYTSPDKNMIKHFLHGNLCRCTGYQKIIDAVHEVGRDQESPRVRTCQN